MRLVLSIGVLGILCGCHVEAPVTEDEGKLLSMQEYFLDSCETSQCEEGMTCASSSSELIPNRCTLVCQLDSDCEGLSTEEGVTIWCDQREHICAAVCDVNHSCPTALPYCDEGNCVAECGPMTVGTCWGPWTTEARGQDQ